MIATDEVRVWRAPLDLPPALLARLLSSLSADERRRAARFYHPLDRDHFVAARGQLRLLLGELLGTTPEAVRFAYGPQGKPWLPDAAALRFNLSHAGGAALFAFSRGRELGVDIEPLREDFATDEVADCAFSPRELATLRALPPADRLRGFYACWTRKEAFIKAIGLGLSAPLDGFDVTLAPGDPPAIEAVRWAPAEAARWSLRSLDGGAGYAAALAVEGHGFGLSLAELHA